MMRTILESRFGNAIAIWIGNKDQYCFLSDDSCTISVAEAGTNSERELLTFRTPVTHLYRWSHGARFLHEDVLYELSEEGVVQKVDCTTEPRLLRSARWAGDEDVFELLSPDCKRICTLEAQALRIVSNGARSSVCAEVVATPSESWELGSASWSPDSQMVATLRVNYTDASTMPITKWLASKEDVQWVPCTRTGEPYPSTTLVVAIIEKPPAEFNLMSGVGPLVIPIGWRQNSSEFVFMQASRTMNTVQLLAASPDKGTIREILTERSETFFEGLRLYFVAEDMLFELETQQHFLWLSARDEWHQLWLVEWDGTEERCVSPADIEVLQVLRQQPGTSTVFFTGHERERPYDTHLFTLDINNGQCVNVTRLDGQHLIDISPSCVFYLDRHGSLNRDLVTDLYQLTGCRLRSFGTSAMATKDPDTVHTGAQIVNEPSVNEIAVRAADGKTMLWGVLVIPASQMKQRSELPLVDLIYNGPFITWAPRTRYEALTGLAGAFAKVGIAALLVDGRGTPERGKSFQNIVYRAFGEHEVIDHVAALKQVLELYPCINPNRIGIAGGSWGGYMALRAILTFPDIYKCAVATNPVHDLIDHPAAAIEPYMGLPAQNPQGFAAASNFPLVSALRGRLLIVHGTADRNAPLIGTMKMIAEIARCQKDCDLKLFPDEGHQFSERTALYWLDLVLKYFSEHL